MAERFYCPEPIVEGRATLSGDEARHLARVRRLGTGDRVEIFDGFGKAYRAVVDAVGRDRVTLRIEGDPTLEPAQTLELTLASAVPKGDRFDWIVEKATELGVHRLIPLLTERSIVDPRSAKLDRLRRRVVEACKQCGRARLLELNAPMAWSELLAQSDLPTARFLAHPDSVEQASPPWGFHPLGSWPIRQAIVAIGPEGGFTDSEVADAMALDWHPLRLGPTLLRVETAALAACVVVLAGSGSSDLGRGDHAVH